MKILISILIGLFLTTNSYAAEVTVGKVSKTGKKAVIYIPEGMTVEKVAGQRIPGEGMLAEWPAR